VPPVAAEALPVGAVALAALGGAAPEAVGSAWGLIAGASSEAGAADAFGPLLGELDGPAGAVMVAVGTPVDAALVDRCPLRIPK